jgi:hypothetical protein
VITVAWGPNRGGNHATTPPPRVSMRRQYADAMRVENNFRRGRYTASARRHPPPPLREAKASRPKPKRSAWR